MAPKWHRFVACFGNAAFGRLGTGPQLISENFPRVLGSLVGYDMKHVSCGGAHTAVLSGECVRACLPVHELVNRIGMTFQV